MCSPLSSLTLHKPFIPVPKVALRPLYQHDKEPVRWHADGGPVHTVADFLYNKTNVLKLLRIPENSHLLYKLQITGFLLLIPIVPKVKVKFRQGLFNKMSSYSKNTRCLTIRDPDVGRMENSAVCHIPMVRGPLHSPGLEASDLLQYAN